MASKLEKKEGVKKKKKRPENKRANVPETQASGTLMVDACHFDRSTLVLDGYIGNCIRYYGKYYHLGREMHVKSRTICRRTPYTC